MNERARGIDVVALLLVGVLILEGVGLTIGSRSFALMFRDFGSKLPWLTRLFMLPVVPLGVVLGCAAFAIEGVVRRRPEPAMMMRVVVEIVIGVVLLGAFLVAMYLPVFSLAGAVSD